MKAIQSHTSAESRVLARLYLSARYQGR